MHFIMQCEPEWNMLQVTRDINYHNNARAIYLAEQTAAHDIYINQSEFLLPEEQPQK